MRDWQKQVPVVEPCGYSVFQRTTSPVYLIFSYDEARAAARPPLLLPRVQRIAPRWFPPHSQWLQRNEPYAPTPGSPLSCLLLPGHDIYSGAVRPQREGEAQGARTLRLAPLRPAGNVPWGVLPLRCEHDSTPPR